MLLSFKSDSLILGNDENPDGLLIDFKIDNCNGIKCYSFWVTSKYGWGQIFIDWSGKHLTTEY
jgi:hypothetical protein